ncbi:patatin-like phospholipase [Akanthomyces lecanii RCEF 1005]|uniref:Patatin-like phospholipase n=1 Tax=Akanthomyces lecanii RCEF 1005 TaxID=1081108 RepID=A0A162MFL5_CORDF|nr:patatin-like phospholipase [Akanthomyces lecanii RCEF 1005]
MAQVGYAFADVFCMYAYSDKDLEEIARQVAEWMQLATPALRAENRPYLQIVLSGSRWAGKPASHAPDIFHSRLATSARHRSCQFFAGVDFLAVEENHTFKDLLRSLVARAEAVRSCSRQARLLFSVQHFNSLFRRALASMRGSPSLGFDFVSAARQDFPVSRAFSLHLQNFLDQLPTVEDVMDFGSAIAASAILKDHYEVGMHLFRPGDVFSVLYEPLCRTAAREHCLKAAQQFKAAQQLETQFLARTAAHVEALFRRLLAGESALAVHQHTLARFAERWRLVASQDSCFACFNHVASYTACCGHKICTECVQVHGLTEEADPGTFTVKRCPLCGADAGMTVRVRHPNAGDVIICIDGGGVLVMIPLVILALTHAEVGLPIPIQEFFTMAYGSSAGAIATLALWMEGMTPERASAEFEAMAAEVFSPDPELGWLKWAKAVLFGAMYPDAAIEVPLRSVHGRQKLADSTYATRIGTKVGVLAATTEDPHIVLLNNYNGVGGDRIGYSALRGVDSVHTWEA